jgi:hypothetical protein
MSARSRLVVCALSWTLSVLPALAPAVAVALAPGLAAQTLKGDTHEDARFGFKVKPPKDWKAIPVPSGQAWVIGKYMSEKKYFFTEPGGYTSEFQPSMSIVAFVSPELKKAARKAKEKALEEEIKEKIKEKKGTIDIEYEAEYRDFKDYLTKTYSGGGFYFTKEEPGEVDGLRVTFFEAKVEKGANSGPKRLVARVYSLPDVDIAVQVEILDQDYDKLSSLLDSTFKSLKTIPRVGELPTEQGHVGTRFFMSIELMEKLTPAERGLKRIEQQNEAHRQATENLAEGWHSTKIDRFMVVSCADDKFDKRVAGQAGAVFDWLEKNFDYVGPGEYVREPIIRVCKNLEEERSFRESGGWGDLPGLSLECTTNKEYSGSRSFESEYINGFMVQLWFTDRDRDLWWAMPSWLQSGIVDVVSEATEKNGKLDFYRDEWTAQKLREQIRDEKALAPKELMHLTDTDFMGEGDEDTWGRMKEAQALVQYLLVGQGAKGKTKDVVKDYIINLKAVVAEIEKSQESADSSSDTPTTEEEEEKALKAEREMWKKKEQELIDEVTRRTFAGWGDKEWNDLARNYFKSI